MTKTNVDFVILADENQRDRFACRKIEAFYLNGTPVFVRTADAKHTRILDDLLWTFRGGSFVPHEVLDPARPPQSPVVILESTWPETDSGVVINLADGVVPTASGITNILEIVDGDAISKAQARERYRQYRERGYSLQTEHVDSADSTTRE